MIPLKKSNAYNGKICRSIVTIHICIYANREKEREREKKKKPRFDPTLDMKGLE